MTEQSQPAIVYASAQRDSDYDILTRIGVEVTHEKGQKTIWHYKGKTVFQPDYVNNFEDKVLEYFNIKIVYKDENQLTLEI